MPLAKTVPLSPFHCLGIGQISFGYSKTLFLPTVGAVFVYAMTWATKTHVVTKAERIAETRLASVAAPWGRWSHQKRTTRKYQRRQGGADGLSDG